MIILRVLSLRRRSRRTGARGTARLVAHQAQYDLRAFLRDRQGRYFTLILPILFLIIFVGVFGNGTIRSTGVRAATYYVPGIAALAVIAASFVNLAIAITAQRELGVLKRRRATPVSASVLVAGRSATALLVAIGVMFIVLLVGRLGYAVRVRPEAIPGVALTAVVGSVAFCCLAYALSTAIRSADSAQPVVQGLMLPLYFISGVFIPSASLPDWLRRIAALFPVQHLADGLRHALDPARAGVGIVWRDIAMLALWGSAGLLIALARFRWNPRSADG